MTWFTWQLLFSHTKEFISTFFHIFEILFPISEPDHNFGCGACARHNSISIGECHFPFPIPGQRSLSLFQASCVERIEGQNGKSLHCAGRRSYKAHPYPHSPKKTHSPVDLSSRDRTFSPARKLSLVKATTGFCSLLEMASASSGVTNTVPGSPLQHLPQLTHEKCKPSFHQGLFLFNHAFPAFSTSPKGPRSL